MKKHVVVLLALIAVGCAHTSENRTPEVVASCFGEGENQDVCKAERINEENKSVVTRCIGSQNRNALASLRGKCVEKICSKGSNTDCQLRGEVGVLDQYSELMRHRFFAEDEDAPAGQSAKKIAKGGKGKKIKGKKGLKEVQQDLDVDPMAELPKMPVKEEPVVAKPAPKPVSTEPAEPAPINVTLKADNGGKARRPANAPQVSRAPNTAGDADGFKKVCVAKNDVKAPEILRGKCATRTCNEGKCSYGGRKEMFDWVARSSN